MDKMDRESSLQNWNAFTRPKDKTILYFSGSPTQGPWQGCCWNLPRESNAVRRSCFLPPPYRHSDIAPPPTTRLRPLWTASLSSGSDQRRISGCGTGRLLAGPDSLPLWLCRVSMVYVLLCCWGVFPVLTLYSPRSIVWGLFFFSSLSSCYAVSSILLAFHYWLYSVWLCMWRIIKNLEPWTNLSLLPYCRELLGTVLDSVTEQSSLRDESIEKAYFINFARSTRLSHGWRSWTTSVDIAFP